MTYEEAKRSRYRSVITRAIGLYPSVQADVMASRSSRATGCPELDGSPTRYLST